MSDFTIDKLNLDMECIRQAGLYKKYSDNLASATFNRDKCKEELDRLEAEIDLEIRAYPEEYGLPARPTESAIKTTVAVDDRLKEKKSEYLDLCYEANVLFGSKGGMEQKKSALEMLVKLFVAGYWADPKVSMEDSKEFEEMVVEKDSHDALNENPRLKKRRDNVN